MTVLVVGASGAIGSLVVAGLLEHGEQVRATSRDPRRLTLPPQVETCAVDLDDPTSLATALDGIDRVFVYADVQDPGTLVTPLTRSGVRHVVLLSSAAVTRPGVEHDYNGSRFLHVEQAIEESGLGSTFLRPGGFASNAARWAWGVRAQSAVPLPYPDAVQAPVHEADIADIAVLALTGDDLVGARPVLTGPERLTLREHVTTICSVVGRPVAVVEQTEAESTAMLAQHVPEVWVHQILKDWREAVGTTPEISQEYPRLTGRPARTFRTWVRDHVDLFR